ncbi:MAG: sigma-54 dependent transcriptional regulator [Planctomycetia bacterium]|nr:sigma-54 dependent transcriptional regulator [Planctomycetia bacterium]
MTESSCNANAFDPAQVELLFVDDDNEFRDTASRRFARRGFRVHEAPGVNDALRLLQDRQFDVVVSDMAMPGLTGLDLLQRVKELSPECEVILLTGEGTVETAVQAMKLGAYDFLSKPFSLAELETLIQKAYERRRLSQENRQLKAVLERSQPKVPMIGESLAMQDVFKLIAKAGPSDKAILVQGESGTGKELVARALHEHSSRAGRPLISINCTALTETLLESELFGHEKGAFTGAIAAKPGLFELADGGTLFIDEIGEMPGVMQAKLLRVLQDGSMRRVGSLQERRVNVRVITATNRDLAAEVAAHRFREDLYYRINVMSLDLPPLRIRSGDIPLLVNHFLGTVWQIAPDALRVLETYNWPGNIRQLINVIERAKILADDHFITTDELPAVVLSPVVATSTTGSASSIVPLLPVDDGTLSAIEKARVVDVMQKQKGNKSRAAQVLGVSRRSLYRLLEKYGLDGVSPAAETLNSPT